MVNISKVLNVIKALGPGMIITASFIGPGTVTAMTACWCGLWLQFVMGRIIFSNYDYCIARDDIRLTLVTRRGLGEAIYDLFNHKVGKFLTVWISMIAVAVGCAAYMSGDLLGTSLGLGHLLNIPTNILAPIVGIIIFIIGIQGSYKLIEKIMIGLMVVMGITFITTMFLVQQTGENI